MIDLIVPASKYLLYVSVFACVGTILNRTWIAKNITKHIPIMGQVRLLAVTMSIAAALYFVSNYIFLMGAFLVPFDYEIFQFLLVQTSLGKLSAVIFLVGGALCIIVRQRWLMLGLVTIVPAAFAFWGHFADLGGLAIFALFLHILIGCAWVGVIIPLLKLSAKVEWLTDLKHVSVRFGELAMITVPCLVIAGTYLAYLKVGSFGALFSTAYGNVLLVKIGLVSTVLFIAALNKLYFVPNIEGPRSTRNFRVALAIELIVILAILLATNRLTATV